ncbi:outer membrane beta-barrel protein [Pontibacter chinhatensis]|uniref:Outer membrane protein beta-barrel domain-containing protein n=1 Tax=Pontibacter chinhatensis TaxID=1436961 RepID=A0A1I2NWW0_9BACT|nr:outer membrane beta-barrel protein [Pontibacter chinhatensis]SFG05966.1 Outer membrane protein beta-barrel domain-containing protein [Pontibacter chinhatensis]
MKKLLFTVLLACIGSAALAQTSRGTVVASGSLSYYDHTDKTEDEISSTENRSFSIAPGIGYMIIENLEAGISFRFTTSIQTANSAHLNQWGIREPYSLTESKDKSFAITPYVKKYFTLSEKIAFTGEAYLSFSKGDSRYESEILEYSRTESNRSDTGFGVGIRPGITFFPTEKIGLSANFGRLGYNHTTHKIEEYDFKSKSSDFGLNLDGSTLSFSFGYYISR